MNRKRGYRDDNRDDRPRKHRRRNDSEADMEEENIDIKIENLIVHVGSKSHSNLEANLQDLADMLGKDMIEHKAKITNVICECVVEIPEKACIYSTLVGLLNAANFKLGGEIVELLVTNFKDYLKTFEWEKARAVLRMFGDLVNCHVISSGSLMNLFESLVDVTMEDNIPQARSDYYIYSVLSTLPWVGKELYEKKEQDLEQLLNTVDNYISKRTKTHHTALRVWYSDTPHPQEEYLECLWTQISKLRADKWVERQIIRPYLNMDNVLCEALQHNLPQIQPPAHDSSIVYPYPKVVFRLFDYTDCPDDPVLPGAHSIERYLVEETVRWIVDQNYYIRKDCAAMLLSIPCKHAVPLDYIIVEVIFAELFALPTPKHLEIVYGVLLLELCKQKSSTLPQVLAQAVELIFERLDTMNVACIDRFASWFSYHLSNFQFRWTWEDWSACLSVDPLHAKQKFVRETLHRCMRLSYHQRIFDIVPESFQALLPDAPMPKNKYCDDEESALPNSPVANALMNSLKEKCEPEKALEAIENIPNPLQESDEEPNYHPVKINVFVTQLLNVVSKSFSHLFHGIAKYESCLKALNTSEEAQICMLKTIFEVWSSHQQLIIVLTEKLLKAGIVNHASVTNWLFSKDMSKELMNSYVWELLHSTVHRKVRAVQSLQKELEEAKEKLRKSEESEMETKAEEEEEEGDESKNVPSEKMVEDLEEKLEAAQSDEKGLFLIIFQRFIMILSEHIQSCESQGKSFKNHWFRWMIGRLQQVFFEHHESVFRYVSTLESLLFTSDLDQHILLIFKQFCSLRA